MRYTLARGLSMTSMTTAPVEQNVDQAMPAEPAWYRRLGTDYLPFVLLAPAVITLLALTIYPLLYSLYISFFRVSDKADEFIGLDNYARLLRDGSFWESIKVVIIFIAVAVSLELVLGLALAMFFAGKFIFRSLSRSLIIVPMMMTPVVIGIIWRLMY